MGQRRRASTWGGLLLALLVCGLGASASAVSGSAPAPGSAAQVHSLVAAASTITALPASSSPALSFEPEDSASREFPATSHGCYTTRACVFGDRSARRTIVLFGDSHAQMWLSAVSPAARALRYRVVLLFLGGCPFASVTVWNPIPLPPYPAGYYYGCNAFRRDSIRAIDRLHPALVLLSNRTALVPSGAGTYFSRAKWQHGVRTTILHLRRYVHRIAVLGDVDYMSKDPPECLAAYPSGVQRCASPNPNLSSHGHEAAERNEARRLGVRFINTLPWICTRTCSPVIGSFLVYLNNAHLDATYVAYLSQVMTAALRRVLE